MLKCNIDKQTNDCSIETSGTVSDMVGDLLNLIGPLYFETLRVSRQAALHFRALLLMELARNDYWDRDWTKGGGYSAINIPRRAPEGQS